MGKLLRFVSLTRMNINLLSHDWKAKVTITNQEILLRCPSLNRKRKKKKKKNQIFPSKPTFLEIIKA